MLEVLIESRAEKDLRNLDRGIWNRVVPSLKSLADNPFPNGCRKLHGSKNIWRIRVGDYRVVYEVESKAAVVRIMRIRHRKEVYR